MTSEPDLKKLSTAELKERANQMLEMARKREAEENAIRKEKLNTLEGERDNLLSKLDKINTEISELGGRAVVYHHEAIKRDGMNISETIVNYVRERGTASSSELKRHIESIGMNSANLGQMVAYLKRQNRLRSAGRGLYSIPGNDSQD